MRGVAPTDGPALVDGLNDWDVARWLARVPSPYTAGDAADFLDRARPGGDLEGQGEAVRAVARRDDPARLLGLIGLGAELGYWLARPAWGRRLASEAVAALLVHHFADPGAPDVIAHVFDGNERSERLLLRLGFAPEGIEPRFCLARGEDVPSRWMRLTRAARQARLQPTHPTGSPAPPTSHAPRP
nr:GNAT family N-acetyltransferase [Rubellimicrobium aerolatum]